MSTLVEELEQAADEIDRLCTCNFMSCPNKERTARLRKRVEHIKALDAAAGHARRTPDVKSGMREMYDALAGDL